MKAQGLISNVWSAQRSEEVRDFRCASKFGTSSLGMKGGGMAVLQRSALDKLHKQVQNSLNTVRKTAFVMSVVPAGFDSYLNDFVAAQ